MRGKVTWVGMAVVLAMIAGGGAWWLRNAARHRALPVVKASEAPALPAEISVAGKIEPQHVVVVGAQVTGILEEVLAEVGQDVFAGELLARISNQGLQAAEESAKAAADLAQERVEKAGTAIIAARLEATRARADATRARTELGRAQRAFERQQMLQREGATPRLVFEKSQSDFERAQSESQSLEDLARIAESRIEDLVKEQESARRLLDDKNRELEDAHASLQNAEVHSPVDGLLVERKGEVGREMSVEEQAQMFKIAVNLAELQTTVTLDAAVASRVKAGDAALVTVAELGVDGLAGAVQSVAGNQATVTFTSPNPAMKPGMLAQIKLRLR